jgi:hypothetical protein
MKNLFLFFGRLFAPFFARFTAGGVPPNTGWIIESSEIIQSPNPPNAALYRIVGTTVEVI